MVLAAGCLDIPGPAIDRDAAGLGDGAGPDARDCETPLETFCGAEPQLDLDFACERDLALWEVLYESNCVADLDPAREALRFTTSEPGDAVCQLAINFDLTSHAIAFELLDPADAAPAEVTVHDGDDNNFLLSRSNGEISAIQCVEQGSNCSLLGNADAPAGPSMWMRMRDDVETGDLVFEFEGTSGWITLPGFAPARAEDRGPVSCVTLWVGSRTLGAATGGLEARLGRLQIQSTP
jgi:hypothetical protein